MKKTKKYATQSPKLLMPIVTSGLLISLVGCSNSKLEPQSNVNTNKIAQPIPATQFDLSHWKLTLPTDSDLDGKVDGVSTAELQSYSHQDFFHLDEQNHLVFTAPNKGGTTKNSHNTRSELRYMSRGNDYSIESSHDPRNNFAIASHPNASEFASIGGKMEVTMHVDHARAILTNLIKVHRMQL